MTLSSAIVSASRVAIFRSGGGLLLGLLFVCALGCTDAESTKETTAVSRTPTSTASERTDLSREEALLKKYDTTIPMVTYAWDRDAGDPTVPAELGGPGFTGEGWTTNLTFPAMGSDEALKGGSLTLDAPDWPATLRQDGKDWNTWLNYIIRDLTYSRLVTYHWSTLEYIPVIATHWWISEDKTTYRFRINPSARFSDGSEITAEDVIATFRLKMDETLLFPLNVLVFGKLNMPTAISKYIVEVTSKEENWRNFLYFGGMSIFPAKEIAMTGREYLDRYQNSYVSFSGPYEVKPDDIVLNKSIALRRNPNWWDADNPAWTGLFNIDTFKFVVIKERALAFEKLKQGDIDYYVIPKAQWWAEELPKLDTVQRGLIARTKVYSDAPIGTSGIALNMQRKPLDDLRIRKALQFLFDRETLIAKLYYDEYRPLNSYWQGGTYQAPGNEMYGYDEFAAVELLEEAGWTDLDDDGYRTKDGELLEFDVNYRSRLSEPALTVYQNSCKRAGIKLNLQLLTPASFWKNQQQKKFDLSFTNWGALVFPNPENSWHSRLADQTSNNNITGFKDPRVDELCQAYDREYDVHKRRELVRQIDAIIYEQVPYVLAWYNPSQRVVHWNKFSFPKWGGNRVHDRHEIPYCWWVDPEKEKAIEAARNDPALRVPVHEVENRFWAAWNFAQEKKKLVTTNP